MIPPEKIDWNNLTFSHTPTRSMFMARCELGGEWETEGLVPFGDLPISPAAGVLNYGQGLFEGMKAYPCKDGRVLLFRPTENAFRAAAGCRRLCMPQVSEDLFMEAVRLVVKDNSDYIPKHGQGALYIRPVVWGTGPILGVSPAPSYTFCVFVSPVGPYFKTGFRPISLMVTTDYHRAALKGTGGIKAIGNYAAGMLPAKGAKAQGFAEVIYLDSVQERYVEEVGAANFFCLTDHTLMTPALTGSILPGVTRKSVLHLGRHRFGLHTAEKRIDIDDVMTSDEAFGTGTAAVITPIGWITYRGTEQAVNDGKVGKMTQQFYDTLTAIQTGAIEDEYGWTVELEV